MYLMKGVIMFDAMCGFAVFASCQRSFPAVGVLHLCKLIVPQDGAGNSVRAKAQGINVIPVQVFNRLKST